MVAEVGLEPTRSCDQRILSPLWLPLHHSAIVTKDLFLVYIFFRKFQDIYSLKKITSSLSPNFFCSLLEFCFQYKIILAFDIFIPL